jgi:hypothetical protein
MTPDLHHELAPERGRHPRASRFAGPRSRAGGRGSGDDAAGGHRAAVVRQRAEGDGRPADRGRLAAGRPAVDRGLLQQARQPEAAGVLVVRTGIRPDVFYLAAAAGDLTRLARWFDGGRLRPGGDAHRPDFTDVGWPGRAVRDDPDDVLAEGLAFAAHLGRDQACAFLLDRGADPARAPLYDITARHHRTTSPHDITARHFAASTSHLSTVTLLVDHGASVEARDRLHHGTRPTGLGTAATTTRPCCGYSAPATDCRSAAACLPP